MQRLHATAHATISNVAMYTLGTAAKSVGRNKSTILRAIKNGVISATKGPQGDYQIDPAELHRIYPPVASSVKAQPDTHTDAPHEGTLDATPLLSENRELRAKLEAAEERLKDRAEVIGDLRRRLDLSEEERRATQTQLTALLTDQRAKPESPKTGFWRRLLGFHYHWNQNIR